MFGGGPQWQGSGWQAALRHSRRLLLPMLLLLLLLLLRQGSGGLFGILGEVLARVLFLPRASPWRTPDPAPSPSSSPVPPLDRTRPANVPRLSASRQSPSPRRIVCSQRQLRHELHQKTARRSMLLGMNVVRD